MLTQGLVLASRGLAPHILQQVDRQDAAAQSHGAVLLRPVGIAWVGRRETEGRGARQGLARVYNLAFLACHTRRRRSIQGSR